MVEKDVIKLEYISTEDQIVDILTKPLAKTKVELFCKELGMIVKSKDMSQRNLSLYIIIKTCVNL